MLIFVKLLIPALAGGVAAGAITYGAIQVQTAGPDASQNPAKQQILTYGDE